MAEAQEAMAQQAAKALRDSAREHKRASSFHRRAAQRDMEAFAKLQEACRALGITLSEDA